MSAICILKSALIYRRMSSWIDYVSNLIAMIICALHAAKMGNTSLSNNEGKQVEWLVVCHNGWDAIIKQFFGVLVHFIA
jgi:hypothetical protein